MEVGGGGRRQARDRQQGQAAAHGSPLRCAPAAFINGGGCAASLINQWMRLRRSEYLRGTDWAIPAWAARCRTCWTVGGNAVACSVTAVPAAVAGRLVRRLPWAAPPVRLVRREAARRRSFHATRGGLGSLRRSCSHWVAPPATASPRCCAARRYSPTARRSPRTAGNPAAAICFCVAPMSYPMRANRFVPALMSHTA